MANITLKTAAIISLILSAIDPNFALSCYQCADYDKFLQSPKFSADCRNSSTFELVTCDADSQFCLLIKGGVTTSGGSVTNTSSIAVEGLQRGCFNPSTAQFFTPSGNSYRQGGDCQQTKWKIIAPANSFGPLSNSTPQYTFSGTYCLCQGDKCNIGNSLWSMTYLLVAAFMATVCFNI